MVCNWHVITCHYMHYMPLHAIEDANGEAYGCRGRGRPASGRKPVQEAGSRPGGSGHLESCTPGQEWAKWYVLVPLASSMACNGM